MRRVAAVFLLSMAWVPAANACELPRNWLVLTPQSATELTGAVRLSALPAPVSGPFDAEMVFCPDAVTLPVTRVQVDARMPAHQHAMNYLPVVSPLEDNRFAIEGLVFHMPGAWEITVSAYAGDEVTHFTVDVPAQ